MDSGNSTEDPAMIAVDSLQVAQSIIQAYIVPLLAVVGMVTNIISVVVFFKFRHKDSSNLQYLMFLAIVDCFNCGYDFATQFPLHGMNALSGDELGIDIILMTTGSCKFLRFLVQWLRLLSTYALVMYSLERCLAVNVPLKVATWFTTSKRKIALVILSFLAFALSAKTLFMYNLYEEKGIEQCYLDPIFSVEIRLFVSCFELLLINIIPSVLITIFNALICFALYRRTESKANLSSKTDGRLSNAELRCILNLLGISALYVITSIPHITLWTMFDVYAVVESVNNVKLDIDWDLLFRAAKLSDSILVVNFAANFLIYALSLDWYREEIKTWFCGRKK